MHIAEITSVAGASRRRKRLGRGPGSGDGKTCGRGHKGGGQRAGWKVRGMQEGGQMPTFRRMPKRGFSNAPFRSRYSVVNVGTLEERFEGGTHVTPQLLVASGLVRDLKLPIKILGDGTLEKKLQVDATKFSKAAVAKIEAAGGAANVEPQSKLMAAE